MFDDAARAWREVVERTMRAEGSLARGAHIGIHIQHQHNLYEFVRTDTGEVIARMTVNSL